MPVIHAICRATGASEGKPARPVHMKHVHAESSMKKLATIAAAAAFLMSGTAAFAQASGAMSNDAMSNGAMSHDSTSHDSMSKSSGSKDKMKHDSMKKGDCAMGMSHEASGAMSH